MTHAYPNPAQRIAFLERVIASERQLRFHPTYGIAAGRLISQARNELAVLRAGRERRHRLWRVGESRTAS